MDTSQRVISMFRASSISSSVIADGPVFFSPARFMNTVSVLSVRACVIALALFRPATIFSASFRIPPASAIRISTNSSMSALIAAPQTNEAEPKGPAS